MPMTFEQALQAAVDETEKLKARGAVNIQFRPVYHYGHGWYVDGTYDLPPTAERWRPVLEGEPQ
jgi:hypothetical protein